MEKFKVYVSDYDYPDLEIEKGILEPIGAEIIGLQCNTGKGLAEQAEDADVILQQYAQIGRDTISKLKKCKAICRYGIGLDIVDLEAAHEHGIQVTNVPDYCIDEVAEHAITLAFMLLRRIPMYARATREGRWHWRESGAPLRQFRNLTCGIIGFGRITQNMIHKIKPFGFKIQVYDPHVSESYMRSFGVLKKGLETVLQTSDLVTVMCPYNEETHHLMNDKTLKMMKQTAVLINCSRAKVVNNASLYKALSRGWIASAGLDDVEEEPAKLEAWAPSDNPLFSLDNCIITPHVAYASENALKECRQVAAENAKAVLLGQTPPNICKPD
jgi:D-3-phosphoglycerate dehydrogenase / 2-oxoglutarate reductase